VTARRNQGAKAFWAFRATPGIRNKAAFAKALLLPDRAFLASTAGQRYPTYAARWKGAARLLSRRDRRGEVNGN
jgi:hypothetical protein